VDTIDSKAVQQLTLVVIVDKGEIDDIAWDDTCLSCGGSSCTDGNCGTFFTDCGSKGCDLKVSFYVFGNPAVNEMECCGLCRFTCHGTVLTRTDSIC